MCCAPACCRMWVPWEHEDPVVWHHPGRKRVGYFGAVRLRDGPGLFQKEPGMFDGMTFWTFLQRLHSVSIREGRRVIVIIEKAKYRHASLHRQRRAERAAGFLLDYLPPYSPEPNPIERVWKRPGATALAVSTSLPSAFGNSSTRRLWPQVTSGNLAKNLDNTWN
jgi:hypothetical protein